MNWRGQRRANLIADGDPLPISNKARPSVQAGPFSSSHPASERIKSVRMRIALCLSCRVAPTLALVAINVHAADFHIAPHGHDANPGTQAKPFATLERARDAIRELKKTGPLREPVTVRLGGGTYALTQEVRFGPEDSGTTDCPITYTAAEGAAVVLDGGRRITGWKKHDDKLWVATVPEVASGPWRFRQLYVNGQQHADGGRKIPAVMVEPVVRARADSIHWVCGRGCAAGRSRKAAGTATHRWPLRASPPPKVCHRASSSP